MKDSATPKKPTLKEKYIVWSFDADESQTFDDVVDATSADEAAESVMRDRDYATLDAVVKPMLLEKYISALQEELLEDDGKVSKGDKTAAGESGEPR